LSRVSGEPSRPDRWPGDTPVSQERRASLGWEAKAGPKYLRFIHRSDDGRATLYANSRDLMTRERRDYAARIPGAIPKKNEIRWRYYGDNLGAALEAAGCLANHAFVVGGEDPDEE